MNTSLFSLTAFCAAVSLSSCAQAQNAPAKKPVAKKAVANPKAQTVATRNDGTITLPGLSVALDVGSPLFIVTPGQEDKAALTIANATNAPQQLQMRVEVESFDGSIQKDTANLTVPAKATARWPIPRDLLGELGIKYVRATLEQNGVVASPVSLSLSYMKPSGRYERQPGDFIFGIAYGTSPDELRPLSAQASALAGVDVVRTNPRWNRVQNKDGGFDFEDPDKRLAVNQSQGLNSQWLLLGTPGWAVLPEYEKGKERDYIKPPKPEVWREFIAAMANKYDDKPRTWEIWNEPDIGFFSGTVPQYLELQRIAYQEIKKADPRQTVLSGGFTSSQHRETKEGMVEGALREGNFDALAYHQHGPFDAFEREIDGYLLPLMKKLGREGMPLYFTETAMDTRYGERYQAETLVKKLTFAWARGAMAYTWFNLRDSVKAKTATQPGRTYGLYSQDDQPKAAYPTFNALTALLRDKRFSKQYELPGEQWAFLFETPDKSEQVLVAWNESGARDGSQLVLGSDATQIESVDLMGNMTAASTLEKRVLWPIETTPRYLVLRGATSQPQIAGELASVAERFAALPGQTLPIAAQLFNPSDAAREFNLSWKLPAQFGGQTVARKVTVAPGARQNVGIEVPIPADYEARFGSGRNLNLAYRVAGTPWSGELKIPIEMGAFTLPADYARKAAFVLDEQGQVTNLTENDPNTEYLLWRGADDLSARVFLARANGALRVRVIVRDNAFSQESSSRFWDGDSVQIALQAPGQNGTIELTLADKKGEPVVQVNSVPIGLDAATFNPTLQIERDGANRTYELTLPDTLSKISDAQWKAGVRFNVLVNDNDGRGRKGYIALAPGLGDSTDASQFPLLVAGAKQDDKE